MIRVGFIFVSLFFQVVAIVSASAENRDTIQERHEKIRASLVFVEAEGFDSKGVPIKKIATGTVINNQGYILTVNHLLSGMENAVDGSIKVTGRIGGKFSLPVELRTLKSSPDRDILILTFPDTGFSMRPACLIFDGSTQIDDEIATSGFPVALDYTSHSGVINSKAGPPERPGLWRTNMPFNRGQSGSPVYDKNGHVIGIASGSIKNAEGLHFFQPLTEVSSEVRDFSSCQGNEGFSITSSNTVETLTNDIKSCIDTAFKARRKRSFAREGSVRCPGGGCFLRSSDCNHRSAELRYDAPQDYKISAVNFRVTGANDAVNGPLIQTPNGGKVTRASILLRCAPSSAPGSGGGWSNGVLEGTETHTNVRSLMSSIREECGAPAL